MKKVFYLAMPLFALLMMCCVACNHENDEVDDDFTEETRDLRSNYYELVCGEWTNERTWDNVRLKQNYEFLKGGQMIGHISLTALKDADAWETLIDENVAGTWNLRYDSSLQKNIIKIVMDGKTQHLTSNSEFFDATDSTLAIVSPVFVDQKIVMHRE